MGRCDLRILFLFLCFFAVNNGFLPFRHPCLFFSCLPWPSDMFFSYIQNSLLRITLFYLLSCLLFLNFFIFSVFQLYTMEFLPAGCEWLTGLVLVPSALPVFLNLCCFIFMQRSPSLLVLGANGPFIL
jgi:hypothetical protein